MAPRALKTFTRSALDEVRRPGLLTVAGGIAALAAWAAAMRYQARRAERAHPPIGRFVDAGGVRLHYIEKGNGRPVVLIHGAGSMVQDFSLSIMDRLSQSYRVLAFDRPGAGYSERPAGRRWTPACQADVLRQGLRRLGVDRPVLVGHSWGCAVALSLALRHPAEVAGIVLMAGYYYPTGRLDTAMLAMPSWPVIGPLMRNTVSPLAGAGLMPAFMKRLFAPNEVPEAMKRWFPYSLLLRPWHMRAAAEDLGFLKRSVAEMAPHYAEITVPVTIVAGAQDKIAEPYRHALRLHRDIAHSDLEVLAETGHMVHHVRPSEVVEAIGGTWLQADLLERTARREHRAVQQEPTRH